MKKIRVTPPDVVFLIVVQSTILRCLCGPRQLGLREFHLPHGVRSTPGMTTLLRSPCPRIELGRIVDLSGQNH